MTAALHDELAAVRADIARLQAILAAAPKRTRAKTLAVAGQALDQLQAEVDRALSVTLATAQAGRPIDLRFRELSPGAAALLAVGRASFLKTLTKHADTLPAGLSPEEQTALDVRFEALQRREVAIMRVLEIAGNRVDPRPDADPIFDLTYSPDADLFRSADA